MTDSPQIENLQAELKQMKYENEELLTLCHNLRREKDSLILKNKHKDELIAEYVRTPRRYKVRPEQAATNG